MWVPAGAFKLCDVTGNWRGNFKAASPPALYFFARLLAYQAFSHGMSGTFGSVKH